MNNFPALLLAMFFLGIGPTALLSQQSPPTPPSAPFVRNAPATAAWTIEHRKSEELSKDKAADAAPKSSKVVLRKTEVTKFGPNRREIEEWSDGSKVEKWFYKGYHIFKQRGVEDVYVVDSSRDGFQRLTFPDYSKDDFPELAWLSAKTYVKNDSFQNQTAFLFEQPADIVAGPVLAQVKAATGEDLAQKPKAPQKMLRVWIDPASRLPIAIDNGFRTKTYSFRQSSDSAAQPPEAFLKALQDYQKSRAVPPSR